MRYIHTLLYHLIHSLIQKQKLIKTSLYAMFICVLIFSSYHMGRHFFAQQKRFIDVESHIPATILAKRHGYDLGGFGLSFVSAEGVGSTYGKGAFDVLEKGITPRGFSHYTSTIGLQGYFYSWLYEVASSLGATSFRPLFLINALCSALGVLLVALLFGQIFGILFGGVLFASCYMSDWVARFGGSLYFSFFFWLLPAIISSLIYIYIYRELQSKALY